MDRRRFNAMLAAMAATPFALKGGNAVAQDATPEASPVAEPTPTLIVASGLTNPRGFIWNSEGVLHVALAGSGGATEPTEEAPFQAILGKPKGGPTGAVVKIGEYGCPEAIATGLPSNLFQDGSVLGAEDLAILGGVLYVSVDGGGPTHGNPDQPSGVYKIGEDGSAELVADLSKFLRETPPAAIPPDWDPDADGYRMIADEAAGALWVIEPNAGGILQVTPAGEIKRAYDWSGEHPVPSCIALDGMGGIYVSQLTVVPYPDGGAWVRHVDKDGKIENVWTGLTMVTGIAVGPEGELYACEMATGNIGQPPFIAPGTGAVVKQTGPDTKEVIASGLNFPVAMGIGPDGGIYVSTPGIGANDGSGTILQVANVSGEPLDLSKPQPKIACAPIPETLFIPTAEAAPEVSPEATPVV